MSDLTITMRSVEALVPYARNARTHSDEQVAQVAASIREFGFTNPILVDGENGIIAGHGRLAAARKLGMEKVPVIALDHLTDAQKRALVLADNKLALNSGWDDDLLKVELDDLSAAGFDLNGIVGFTDAEMDLIGGEWTTDYDVEEKDGSHTNAIAAKIVVKVPAGDEDFIRGLIEDALADTSVDWSIA